ncbi:radical SAM/CxCxxxxC motif protein YfkAB [Paenibacillus thermotolerans]|uniref:radical SAM/CxCxxxxC motif protein YfkAB n=1 Tax=Paenibacillus thermotolerans TaxID=3027807 RepID=UPI002368A7BC|nr:MULTISPECIES: radical SAM/CxCxxxxC motif protein YfkAB [unclassified Paenibacillus]
MNSLKSDTLNTLNALDTFDPWDPLHSRIRYGRHVLTSVEFTVTQLCNMRCEHCAVGDALVMKEGPRVPLPLLLQRLDEVETLATISVTGGEPTYDAESLRSYIVPLLDYAKRRGVRTQINTNLTLGYDRYELLAPYVDVFHISYNYTGVEDFHEIGFAKGARKVGRDSAARLYERMMENARRLASSGAFVSAESMINYRTHRHISDIHKAIYEMGCRRHEVHPMYPSAFAADLPLLPLEELRKSIHGLLDDRAPNVWVLFGTLPFYACSERAEDRELLQRLRREPNVTVRNDPDGRNRLNVNTFTGDVTVTDFSDVPPVGNVRDGAFTDLFDKWSRTELQRKVSCFCSGAACCGPNLLVADMYYKDVDFTTKRAP